MRQLIKREACCRERMREMKLYLCVLPGLLLIRQIGQEVVFTYRSRNHAWMFVLTPAPTGCVCAWFWVHVCRSDRVCLFRWISLGVLDINLICVLCLLKVKVKPATESLLCFPSPSSDDWVLEKIMRRVYVHVCTHCATSHNRVAEGAKCVLGSSSSPVLFALPSSVTQNTSEFNTESFCLSARLLSPRPSVNKSIKNQGLLHKHIRYLSVNWALT